MRGWLGQNCYYKGDIFVKIIEDGDKAVDNFVNAFMKIFNNYKDIVIECNEIFEKKENNTKPFHYLKLYIILF
jgi:hypothetical protein